VNVDDEAWQRVASLLTRKWDISRARGSAGEAG
jgi:hypothetical protein